MKEQTLHRMIIIISTVGPGELSRTIASLIFCYLMFVTSPAEDLGT